MDLDALEAADGVRFTWQYWLASKQAQAKLAVPPAVLVTIAKDIPDLPVLPYSPTPCRQCKAILSCHAAVDYASKLWTCPFWCVNGWGGRDGEGAGGLDVLCPLARRLGMSIGGSSTASSGTSCTIATSYTRSCGAARYQR